METARAWLDRVAEEDFGAGLAGLPEDAKLRDHGLDSLDVLELTMAVEDAFGCEIDDAEVGDIDNVTVGRMLDLLERHAGLRRA
ncbi:hypothetical protein ISF6_3207 [Piscinibacter sakaiensis]|uniref:Carrier domain-containing protein n=1 Tax=Piscinibacter sakaiensis TaxID=1547922 RepID=A0A0K8P407_PISS1|nr:hypothetical protein ISF6_3207 [Piscinibacter sakaiensis]